MSLEKGRGISAATTADPNRRIGPDKNRAPWAVTFGGFGTADQTVESRPRE